MVHPLALFSMPGIQEWVIIIAIGLLLFGKRLPDMGRSLGRGIVEFKKGLKGMEDEVERASEPPAARAAASQSELPAAKPASQDVAVAAGRQQA